MWTRLYAAEPVLVTLAGSAVVWSAFFNVLESYGFHPSITQQSAVTALFVAIAGVIARSQVKPTP